MLSKKGIIGIPLSICHAKLHGELSTITTFAKSLFNTLKSFIYTPPVDKIQDSLYRTWENKLFSGSRY